MLIDQRPNGTPDEMVFIGIQTTATGRIFDGQMMAVDFRIDPSHGDGFGGLTENQRNVYVQVLRAAADRLDKESGKLIQTN